MVGSGNGEGVTYARVFSLSLAVEWRGGRMVRAEWVPELFGETDPLTQHLVEESMRDPLAVAPYLGEASSVYSGRMREELLRVPLGSLVTYGELACRLGQRGARGVAAALGANPLVWFVPCHRVVRSDGAIGGYSAGVGYKEVLLRAEGARRDGWC